jgi:hypothetical protein
VNVASRRRAAVFWTDESRVRRCSWFYRRESDSKFMPFDEQFSANLEVTLITFARLFVCCVVHSDKQCFS